MDGSSASHSCFLSYFGIKKPLMLVAISTFTFLHVVSSLETKVFAPGHDIQDLVMAWKESVYPRGPNELLAYTFLKLLLTFLPVISAIKVAQALSLSLFTFVSGYYAYKEFGIRGGIIAAILTGNCWAFFEIIFWGGLRNMLGFSVLIPLLFYYRKFVITFNKGELIKCVLFGFLVLISDEWVYVTAFASVVMIHILHFNHEKPREWLLLALIYASVTVVGLCGVPGVPYFNRPEFMINPRLPYFATLLYNRTPIGQLRWIFLNIQIALIIVSSFFALRKLNYRRFYLVWTSVPLILFFAFVVARIGTDATRFLLFTITPLIFLASRGMSINILPHRFKGKDLVSVAILAILLIYLYFGYMSMGNSLNWYSPYGMDDMKAIEFLDGLPKGTVVAPYGFGQWIGALTDHKVLTDFAAGFAAEEQSLNRTEVVKTIMESEWRVSTSYFEIRDVGYGLPNLLFLIQRNTLYLPVFFLQDSAILFNGKQYPILSRTYSLHGIENGVKATAVNYYDGFSLTKELTVLKGSTNVTLSFATSKHMDLTVAITSWYGRQYEVGDWLIERDLGKVVKIAPEPSRTYVNATGQQMMCFQFAGSGVVEVEFNPQPLFDPYLWYGYRPQLLTAYNVTYIVARGLSDALPPRSRVQYLDEVFRNGKTHVYEVLRGS